DDLDTYRQQVENSILRIFEACSFQDITGQRISKVVETLEFIEQRANALKTILGVDPDRDAPPAEPEPDEDRALLRGPALEGEGIDQDAVDALLAGDAAPAPAAPAKKAPAKTKKAAPDMGGKRSRAAPVTSGEVDPL